jgi:hypothetical protein
MTTKKKVTKKKASKPREWWLCVDQQGEIIGYHQDGVLMMAWVAVLLARCGEVVR